MKKIKTTKPDASARKKVIRRGLTEAEARQVCKEYNETHDPGKLGRKAEFTSIINQIKIIGKMRTTINNNERVFMITWSMGNHVFCNLADVNRVVKENDLKAGYFKIYHFWNNKPVKATKKLLIEMLEAHDLKMEFFL